MNISKYLGWLNFFRIKVSKKVKPPKPLYKRILIIALKVVIGILLYFICVDLNLFWLFGKSPKMSDLNNPNQKVASELYSADGKLIGKYFDENRTPATYQELSKNLINALIATEDIRFYEHHGVDFRSTFSVFWYGIKGEKRGGSTITQQLVKNLFKMRTNYSKGLFGYIPGLKMIVTKTKEWITAIKIEMFYTKEDILTMYLNTVDFGSNAFGIKTACKTYFNKKPAQLNIQEAALLIGMLKAPTYYSPISNASRSRDRRNVVLAQLSKYKYITKKQSDSIAKFPLDLDYRVENNYGGNAPYFRDAVNNNLKKWLKDNEYDIWGDGLKIYTTLDSRLQELAEASVLDNMKKLQKRFNQSWDGKNPWANRDGKELEGFIENLARETKYYKVLYRRYGGKKDSVDYYLNKPHKMSVFSWKGDKDTTLSSLDSIRYYAKFLHAGFISMDPNNGYVKVWVGDINYNHFKYDHVKQSKRQPGSTFKAFVYAAAIESGFEPCDRLRDQSITINYVEKGQKKSWSPHNADWIFTGESLTLKHAFARSINSIAVQLTDKIGWHKIIECAYKCGIKTKLSDVPSVCLGSCDVSLFELVNAYCTFLNGGYYVEPVLVTKIEDKDGKVIYENEPIKKRVIDEETAFLMSEMLRAGLLEPGGTTQSLYEYKLFDYNTDFGGKTGTSSNHSDGWFVGVTPKLIGGAWVGGEHRSIHFRSELGEGCHSALPIYGLFMEKMLADKRFIEYRAKFEKPKIKISKSYSCHTGRDMRDSIKAAEKADTLYIE